LNHDAARLQDALGGEALAWLIDRLRRRYASGQNHAISPIILKDPTPSQRDACDRLLRRRPSTGHVLRVRPDHLERIIVDSELAPSLRDAVEALTGPIPNDRARQQQTEQQWTNVFDQLRPDHDPAHALMNWYDDLQRSGLLRRLAEGDPQKGRRLLELTLRVVARLPAPSITIAQLAADCCNDSHALDIRQPVGTLAARAAAAMANMPLEKTAAGRRRVWAAVGVICDELSAPVLVLNLPGDDNGLTSRLLQQCAAVGEPCRITARQLLRFPPSFGRARLGGVVHVCENPSVVAAAADALRDRAKPLLCIEGQPTNAARLLLTALTRAGITLHYHGDFDWGGIRIANHILTTYAARPWRMSSADYLAAATRGGRKLPRNPVPATWDTDLASAMIHKGLAIHEERILDTLLADLAFQSTPSLRHPHAIIKD